MLSLRSRGSLSQSFWAITLPKTPNFYFNMPAKEGIKEREKTKKLAAQNREWEKRCCWEKGREVEEQQNRSCIPLCVCVFSWLLWEDVNIYQLISLCLRKHRKHRRVLNEHKISHPLKAKQTYFQMLISRGLWNYISKGVLLLRKEVRMRTATLFITNF